MRQLISSQICKYTFGIFIITFSCFSPGLRAQQVSQSTATSSKADAKRAADQAAADAKTAAANAKTAADQAAAVAQAAADKAVAAQTAADQATDDAKPAAVQAAVNAKTAAANAKTAADQAAAGAQAAADKAVAAQTAATKAATDAEAPAPTKVADVKPAPGKAAVDKSAGGKKSEKGGDKKDKIGAGNAPPPIVPEKPVTAPEKPPLPAPNISEVAALKAHVDELAAKAAAEWADTKSYVKTATDKAVATARIAFILAALSLLIIAVPSVLMLVLVVRRTGFIRKHLTDRVGAGDHGSDEVLAIVKLALSEGLDQRLATLEEKIQSRVGKVETRMEAIHQSDTLEEKASVDVLLQVLQKIHDRLSTVEVGVCLLSDARGVEHSPSQPDAAAEKFSAQLSGVIEPLARVESGITALRNQAPAATLSLRIASQLETFERLLGRVANEITGTRADVARQIDGYRLANSVLYVKRGQTQPDEEMQSHTEVSTEQPSNTGSSESAIMPVLELLSLQVGGLDTRFGAIESTVAAMPTVADLDRIVALLRALEDRISSTATVADKIPTPHSERIRSPTGTDIKLSVSRPEATSRTVLAPTANLGRPVKTPLPKAAQAILSPDAKEMCEIYNWARENRMGYRDQFNKRYQPIRLGCINAHERRIRGLDLFPIFQEDGAGEYLVVELRGAHYCFPFWTTVVDDPNNAIRKIGGMDEFFDFEEGPAGSRAEPRVLFPAKVIQFEERWEPSEKGLIRA